MCGDGSWVPAGRFSEDCHAILKNRPRRNPGNRPALRLRPVYGVGKIDLILYIVLLIARVFVQSF